jgi:uncharacterized protein (TIGR00730 family)
MEPPKALKAYKNEAFLNSSHARLLRIQCEFEEPRARLEQHGVDNIVMIFGSARSKAPNEYRRNLEDLRERVKTDPKVQAQLIRAERMQFLCRYHDETVKLAKLITEFSMGRPEGCPTYTVGTGAGPGMMEAANEGAWRAGGQSCGFGISLPFETGLNPYVTPELGFEFHYFFTRKFWMAYKCMGLVVSPGGYGTCDELFEILTLMQTQKIKHSPPVVLFGKEYWTDVLHIDVMEEFGVLRKDAKNMIFTCDSAEEAFEYLKQFWLSQEKVGALPSPARKPMRVEPPLKKLRSEEEQPNRPMPPKAYKNLEFITSSHSRIFRIQCEFEETQHRLEAHKISNTIMFCGSAMVRNFADHLEDFVATSKSSEKGAMNADMELLLRQQPLLKYHQVSRDLARRITAWSMERVQHSKPSYHVATGGGHGLQESANEGAWEAGGKSIAFSGNTDASGINKYVTPELAFVFHYFFTRKFWMAYKCMGIVAFPGGFGTCDELFELLTLMQTGKMKQKMPIVLIGEDYWRRVISWRKMADYGMISDNDVEQLLFTDCAEKAFRHITQFWENTEAGSPKSSSKA